MSEGAHRAFTTGAAITGLLFGAALGGCGGTTPQPKPPTAAPVAPPALSPGGQQRPAAPPTSDRAATPGASGTAAGAGATRPPGPAPSLDSLGPISSATSDPTVVSIAGVTAPKPVEWTWIAPTMSFRNLQYTVPAPEGKGESADFIVSVFVTGDGGPIEENLTRWTRQFVDDNDRTVTPTRSLREIDGMKVNLIELTGRYMGMGAASARPETTQLGAIIEAPGANVFLRLLGSDSTVEANRAAWDRLIEGLRRVSPE